MSASGFLISQTDWLTDGSEWLARWTAAADGSASSFCDVSPVVCLCLYVHRELHGLLTVQSSIIVDTRAV